MLLIYSGGLDSTSALYIYKTKIKVAVSFNYGSKHNKKEIDCARQNCFILGIKHITIPIHEISKHLKSALLQDGDFIPHGHYAEDNMSKTVVPFRNGIMLSIAAGIADSHNLKKVVIASHLGDNAQYPDCTPAFNYGMKQAIRMGTKNKIELYTPFEKLNKEEVAKAGIKAGMVPELTYSCYEGDEIHCGKCGTCVERIWALRNEPENTQYKDKEFAIKLLKEAGEW